MNLLADENIELPIVSRLRSDGHLILYVAELDPSIDDDEVMRWANNEGALLLTSDKDFGELVYRQQCVTAGVILLRLSGLLPATKAHVVSRAIAKHDVELPSRFTVVSPGSVRVRQI